jgi:hypothetical protein
MFIPPYGSSSIITASFKLGIKNYYSTLGQRNVARFDTRLAESSVVTSIYVGKTIVVRALKVPGGSDSQIAGHSSNEDGKVVILTHRYISSAPNKYIVSYLLC